MNDANQIKDMILGWGAHMAGVADIQSLDGLPAIPSDLLEPFTNAISIGVHLPVDIFGGISDRPTPGYIAVYREANAILDEVAAKTATHIESLGSRALAIPASEILDRENWMGAVSHKAVALAAGLGWQGKNLLLITPRHGSRVRLVTVLSNAPLKTDAPMKNRCGRCSRCHDACPAGAIKNVNTNSHYESRNEALYFDQCARKLSEEFAKLPGIGAPVCGICIRVCPFTGKGKIRMGI
ncbi:4Fe-4S ferredoxin [Candidatus Desulfarcum epimagneticum]|uniref:4Fe-4S ferredoxin n=1 Tax=uncultured Desulfobacteraceae bacterium TaxID=218296 RepID=A0A484HED8_9BACT|nr:4Fe-4S ferredoxin [uncultured Desulfobacteraceae bacterium]